MSAGKDIKVAIVGDGQVGKATLLKSYTAHKADAGDWSSLPRYANAYKAVGGGPERTAVAFYILRSWDAVELRAEVYAGADVVLLCYKAVERGTFDSVRRRWVPELQAAGCRARLALVACQADLRVDMMLGGKKTFISTALGRIAADQLGAYAFMECTSLDADTLVSSIDDLLLQREGRIRGGASASTDKRMSIIPRLGMRISVKELPVERPGRRREPPRSAIGAASRICGATNAHTPSSSDEDWHSAKFHSAESFDFTTQGAPPPADKGRRPVNEADDRGSRRPLRMRSLPTRRK